MRKTTFFLAILTLIPSITRADGVAPPRTVPTFANQQQLIVSVQQNGVAITDQGTTTLPVGIAQTFTYSIARAANWPDGQTAADKDAYFSYLMVHHKVFLELWRGTPFGPDASLVSDWDVSGSLSGTITATLPTTGNYFFLADYPQYLFRDPSTECASFGTRVEECLPDQTLFTTLDDMRTYFTLPIETRSSRQVSYQWPVFGAVRFWNATSTTPVVSASSNIMFLPGIEGSRLYYRPNGVEKKVWELELGSSKQNVGALYLDKNGKSINNLYVRPGDAVATAQVNTFGLKYDVYRTFFEQLRSLQSQNKIKDYQIAPYDWRLNPIDVVEKGIAYADGTHSLETDLLSLASTSATGRVTVVGHSNGGLVAKALLTKMSRDGMASFVDRVILVDSPQLGTPETLAGMLHGDIEPLTGYGGIFLSKTNARGLVENMPDSYALLPSARYLQSATAPLLDLTAAPALRASAGLTASTTTNVSDVTKFLTGTLGRRKPVATDTETPNILSSNLLASSTTMHTSLDTWTPPNGIDVVQIAGWGIDTTTGITYSEKKLLTCEALSIGCGTVTLRHKLEKSVNGDGAVVLPSEVSTQTGNTFYINLHDANTNLQKNWSHGDVTESTPFQNIFAQLISSSSPNTLPAYVTKTPPTVATSDARLRLRVLSPVSLDAVDTAGRHTGLVSVAGLDSSLLYKEAQIPNSYYEEDGEGKYLGLPDGTQSIRMNGLAAGTFTLELSSVSASGTQTKTFVDIPVTASSTAVVSVSPDTVASAALMVDMNGDGKADITLASSTQSLQPLAYVRLIQAFVASSLLETRIKRQLQAKFANVEHLLIKDARWDEVDDGDDRNDNRKTERIEAQILRKLDRTAVWVRTRMKDGPVLEMIARLHQLIEQK